MNVELNATLVTVLVALLFATILVYLVALERGLFRRHDEPPLVPGLPLVGSFYRFWGDPIKFLNEARERFGDVYAVRLGFIEHIFVHDESFAKEIMKIDEKKMDLMSALLKRGLLIPLAGERILWPKEANFALKLQMAIRKKFSPRLSKFTQMLEDVFVRYVDQISHGSQYGVIESGRFFREVVGRMTLAVFVGPMDKTQEIIDLLFKIIKLFADAEKTLLPGLLSIYMRAKPVHVRFREIMEPILRQRRQWQRENPSHWLEEHGLQDLLSMFLDMYPEGESFDGLTPDRITHTILVSLLGGIFAALGNTAFAVEGAVAHILSDQGVYEDVVNDVKRGFEEHNDVNACDSDDPDSPLPSADSSRRGRPFEFVDACFQEHLRMFPGLMIGRNVVTNSIALPGGFRANKNTIVNIVPYVLMHDEKNFPEPHRFNPYRVFTDRYKKAERDGLCLAFSNGKHKCPGEAMASNEIKVAIRILVRNYHLELLDPFPGIGKLTSATARLKTSVRIRYTRRRAPL